MLQTTLMRQLIFFLLAASVMPRIAYALKMYPYDDKRKAFPIQNGSCSFGLPLTAESPWRIGQSWIVDYDSETLWRRMSKDFYYINGAYSPQTYAVIYGTLVKGYDGEGDSPDFWLTTPSIDLQWGEGCGEARDEKKEDNTPAALLITSDRDAHRRLIVKPARDKYRYGRNVTLAWTNEGCIRVWKSSGGGAESEIHSGVQLYLTGLLSLRIEPVAVSSSKIRFTATGAADDYNGDRVEDSVSAFTYDLTLSGIKFNHNTSSSANDGINLRRSFSDPFSIPNGEWTAADGALAPVCYRINQPITIKAKFKTHSSLLTSARISAENASGDSGEPHCFQTFGAQTVSFSNGQTDDILFTMQGTAPSSISLLEQEHLVWKASRINGDTKAAEVSITNSGPHKVYVILGNPVEPWSNVANNNQNAWTNALEMALHMAGCSGQTTDEGTLSQISQFLFSDHGLCYDTMSGMCSYVVLNLYNRMAAMNFHGYLDKASGNVVNCYDQAAGVTLFGRLLGINADFCFMAPFGYINTTRLVGVTQNCNNPFYNNPSCANHSATVGLDDILPNRTPFGNHAFVSYNGKIFDACAGPALGTQTPAQYVNDVIDRSTPAEASEAGGVSDIIIFPNMFMIDE